MAVCDCYRPLSLRCGYAPDFLSLGFLVAAGLISEAWRRYFSEVSVWVPAVGILSLGLALGALEAEWWWCDVFQVAQNSAFAFTMLALAGIWCALHDSKRQILWLLLGSLAYGLAIGSRPSALFGAIILLLPVAQAWRAATEPGLRWRAGLFLVAALGPLMLIGFGLMLYNFLRFDNPFEFGWRYMLGLPTSQSAGSQFDLRFFGYNFWYYYFEPMKWSGHFPFLETFLPPPAPSGHARGEQYCGGIILVNYPLLWLALAAPLAWKGRPLKEYSFLRWFVGVAFLLFVICALTFSFFLCCESRYELDFLPAGMLVSVIGILGLERALAGFPAWRWIGRAVWCVLLAYSVTVSILATVEGHARSIYFTGNFLVNQGRTGEAIEEFQKALVFEPGSATFHYALANALFLEKRADESIIQYQKALEIKPDMAEARSNLGYVLLQLGRVDEAITNFQKALDIEKNYQVYYNLGYAYRRNGMATNAIACYRKAIDLQPAFIPAQTDLAWMLATWPEASVRNGGEAVAIAEQLNRLSGRPNPKILRTLAAAYAEAGRFDEAIATAQKACALASESADPELLKRSQELLALYLKHQPYHETEVQPAQ
jgi:tetratricopeptide (TPR) repeat protein